MQFVNHCHAWCCTQVATYALLFKKHDVALRTYEKILARQPQHTLTLSRVAFLHAEAGNRPLAITGFERALAINADDSNNWFNLGFLHQENGNHMIAIDAFERAIELNERHDRAWYGKGLSLMALSRFTDAIAPLEKNAELQPMSPHSRIALAQIYFKLNHSDRCEKEMRKLMAFDPKNAAALEDETGIKIGVDRWWQH